MLLKRSAFLLCAVPLAACDQAAEAPAAAAAAPPAVTVITLRLTEFTPGFSFNGRVVAVDKVDVRARVSGFLEQRLFQEGADVAAGDLLFVLEKNQYQATVDQQRADLASAEASKTNTAAQLQRGEELVKKGNIPRSEVDLRRASDDEYEHFLRLAPAVEREVIHNGIILLKYFLDVSQAEQRRHFEARISDPIKHWKLSPMDVESVRRWWDYTKAYQAMLEATDTPAAPWHVVPADDKRRARLNLIRHLLSSIPYEKVRVDLPKIPKATPRPKGAQEGLRAGQIVPNLY